MSFSFKFAVWASATALTLVLVTFASPLSAIAPVSFQCPLRNYDFGSLQPGEPFRDAADGTWSIKVSPTNKDLTDCGAIFDTSFPLYSHRNLGTPGECANGPGRGEGGRRGEPGENCSPLRAVLLCHNGDMEVLRNCVCNKGSCTNCNPDDREIGSVFNISFFKELTFNAVTMIDLEKSPAMTIIHPNGKIVYVDGYGENSVQRVKLDLDVKPGDNVVLQCFESCALARLHINICDEYNLLEPASSNIESIDKLVTMEIDLQPKTTDFKQNMIVENSDGNPHTSHSHFAFTNSPRPTIFVSPQVTDKPKMGRNESLDVMRETPEVTLSPDSSEMEESETVEPSYTPETTASVDLIHSPAPAFLDELLKDPTRLGELTPDELLLPNFPVIQAEGRNPILSPANLAGDPILTPVPSPLSSPIVVQIDMTAESTAPYICTQYTPITFNNLKVGSAIYGGLGFMMHTRRIGNDEYQDASAVFDTSNPRNVDKDLGSPNSKCSGGGPGLGEGGIPGARGENCEPLGKIAIAHSGNVTELRAACNQCPTCQDCSPNDSNLGAEFIFTFTMPSLLHNVVTLDVDDFPSSLVITSPIGIRYEYNGLGDNSKLRVSLRNELAKPGDKLKIFCKGSCGLVSVDRTICTTKSRMASAKNATCHLVHEDFEGRRTGFAIEKGPHWKLETCRFVGLDYQCGVSAAFNTSDPLEQDKDLGTPNEKCRGGGPGVGQGGAPGTRGENCLPLNQVLIGVGGNVSKLREICARQNCRPNDNADGVTFNWVFNRLVGLRNITMLDLDAEKGSATLFLSNGYKLSLNGLGDNSVQTLDLRMVASIYSYLPANQPFVISCSRSCAIASLSYEICD